ncbi:MAG: DNA repair and recombination protein RadB [Thermoplasmata archaeon]|nr:MAG: DNA repair and recombination protein RadB [Thermoplasmata archaeon]
MYIPTKCETLDNLLGGGIESGSLTSLYGEAGSGKTNVCLQLARNVVLNGKKVVFIDTEGVSFTRLKQICGEDFDKVTKDILFFTPFSLEEQEKNVEDAVHLAEAKEEIGLIVLDSATVHYRATFGEECEADGRKSLGRQVNLLLQVSRKKDIPVVITTQVYTDTKTNTFEPIGGHVLMHYAKAIIKLEKLGDGGLRRAMIKKYRWRPEGISAEFKLTENGVEGAN